ncbi:hypothetical protein [Amphibacillus jilinensis]|uniref:hypothetical protein n=1 Tax=Amphibacillus jilinensis TaxID=1216008 RepID=UPI0002FD182E|nr:hypothetical protein [Amphibacillus jilinensis]
MRPFYNYIYEYFFIIRLLRRFEKYKLVILLDGELEAVIQDDYFSVPLAFYDRLEKRTYLLSLYRLRFIACDYFPNTQKVIRTL